MSEPAIKASGLTYSYGDRVACDDISFEVPAGGVWGFLGPNGSGKSTLFKVLTTIYPMQSGHVTMFGHDLARESSAVRAHLGVVFQSPALDRKLTVRENLVHGGHMYGISGKDLHSRVDEAIESAGLTDRAKDRVEELSGGLRRRVELGKALLPRPHCLIMDEPSTGLDPGARRDLWDWVRRLDDVTVLFTTHLMDEAEMADHIAILDDGKIVGEGAPSDLKSEVGSQVLEIESSTAEVLATEIRDGLAAGAEVSVVGRSVRILREDVHQMVGGLMDAFADRINRLTISSPTLEDVYIRKTGHRFVEEEDATGGASK